MSNKVELHVGFAWAQDGRLKLAKAVPEGIQLVADVCDCTHENVDALIQSLHELKQNMRDTFQKLH